MSTGLPALRPEPLIVVVQPPHGCARKLTWDRPNDSTFCLQNGKECEYPDVVDVTELVDLESVSAVVTLCTAAPNHAFVGHAIEMPAKSRWLFHQCK